MALATEQSQNIDTNINDQMSEKNALQDSSWTAPSDEVPSNNSPPSKKPSHAPPGVRYRVEWRDFRTDQILHQQVVKQYPYEPEKVSQERRIFEVVTIFTQNANRKASLSTGDSDSDSDFAAGIEGSFVPDFSEKPQSKLIIYSKAIINALRSVVRYYPSQDLTGSTIVINEPYPVLIHHLEELGQFRDKCNPETHIGPLCEREKDAYHHLMLLINFLDEHIMPRVNAERARNSRGFKTWEMKWLNLKPGVFITSEVNGSIGTFDGVVVHSVVSGDRDWTINVWKLAYDGNFLGRHLTQVISPQFDGEAPLNRPDEECNTDAPDDLMEKLIHRGEKFYRLLKGGCRYYNSSTASFPYHKVDGLVMLDLKGYFSNRPGPRLMNTSHGIRHWVSECTCDVCRARAREDADEQKAHISDIDDIYFEDDPDLSPQDYFLMPRTIIGFVFKTRTWEVLNVEDFQEPQFDPTMIDRLVMDNERRKIIKSLAASFIRKDHTGQTLERQPWQADFVKGKGNGQIFLLHGKPGVGKTYTAECVAEYTRRPLMILTSSDIGTNSEKIESVLTEKFKTAKKWEAILLIDEADIFMERRSTNDLERNTLVAGFLRALEYYDGILFLTTNRVGKFDDAFTSRIHLKLYYPDFSDKDRNDVWQTFMDKLHKDRGSYIRLSIEAREYIRSDTMAKVKWNGREIRNGFQTAVALAEYEGEKDEEGTILVKERHLSSVVKMSLEFQEYLEKLHVGNEGKRAQREGERYDDYDQ